VMLGPEWELAVRQGMRVQAGASILARRREPALVERASARQEAGAWRD
jgi:hypothetical protein